MYFKFINYLLFMDLPNPTLSQTAQFTVVPFLSKAMPKDINLQREDAKAMFKDVGGITNKLFATQDPRLLCTNNGPRLFIQACMAWENLNREATALEIANTVGISKRSAEKHMRDLKKVVNVSLGININRDLKSKIWALSKIDSVAKDVRKIEKDEKRIEKKKRYLRSDIHTIYLQTGKRMHGLIADEIFNNDSQYQN